MRDFFIAGKPLRDVIAYKAELWACGGVRRCFSLVFLIPALHSVRLRQPSITYARRVLRFIGLKQNRSLEVEKGLRAAIYEKLANRLSYATTKGESSRPDGARLLVLEII